MSSNNLYLDTKPARLFMKAAIPGGISMLASSLYTVFDSIFVGKFLGTNAFAALGLAMPLVVMNFALADLIGVGSSVPISIFLGKKEDDKANNYFTCASILIVLTGLLSGILIYLLSPAFMELMGAKGELARLGVKYVRVYGLFSPVITMMFAVDNFLRICGKIKTSMCLNIFMSFGTILLELLFIRVMDMGIVGASLGASLIMFLCVVFGFGMFLGGKLQLKLVKPHFSGAMIMQIVRNGSPAFLTNIAGRIFSIVMNIMLLKLGGASAVAVYGVLMTVGGVVEQILYGVLDSLQPAIGYNYGAGKHDRVKAIEKCCMTAAAVISIASGVVLLAVPEPFAVPFLEDLSLLGIATHALRLFSFTFFVKWISQAIQSFFMAIEKPLPAVCISMSMAFVFPLLMIVVLLPLKLNGLWLNYTCTSFLSAVLALVMLWKMRFGEA